MRTKQEFDKQIRIILENECDGISASEDLKYRIDRAIQEEQEENFMKHISIKKLCVGVAAACMIMSCGSVFASRVVDFVGGSSSVPEYTSYEEIGKAEAEIGFEADHVGRFANGYVFSGACIGEMDAYGEASEKIKTVQTLEMTYSKAGKADVNLYIERELEGISDTKQPDSVRTCGDTVLRYDEYTYKFVPVSYELTEEDEINQQKDNYYISVGTDQVEIQKITRVRWEKCGITYDLFGNDLDLSADEMLDMAEEILAVG